MPTLDDLPALQKLVTLSANDLIPVLDSSVPGPGASKIKHVPAALAAQGYTHAWVINFNNAELKAQTTNATAEAITLLSVPANSVVADVRVAVTTLFAAVGASPAITDLTAIVGKTGTTNAYITTLDIDTAGTRIVNNTGTVIDGKNEADYLSTATDLILTITPTGGKLSELTAGQLVVLANIQTLADYANLVPAT